MAAPHSSTPSTRSWRVAMSQLLRTSFDRVVVVPQHLGRRQVAALVPQAYTDVRTLAWSSSSNVTSTLALWWLVARYADGCPNIVRQAATVHGSVRCPGRSPRRSPR